MFTWNKYTQFSSVQLLSRVQLFAWGGQSTGVSALVSFLPKKSQGWSPSEWTGWNSSQASSQWLRSPVSEHILMSPPKKKKVRAPWSTCVSTRFLWVQFFRVRSFFFPIAFQSLETRESNTWLISPHSFPLFLTCFRNIVSIHGQMYGTGSPLFGSMFSPPPHQSLLGEYLQMIMKMKCWGFPKPKCPALGVHRCGSCLFNDTLCNPQGEGWDSAQRGILCDDSTSKSWAKMQTSWVRCHPEIGCEQGCCTGRILCFSKKRSYAWERG